MRQFDIKRVPIGDDLTIHVRFSGEFNGPTVMFSNSLAADCSMWNDVIVNLPLDWSVICYDTRGHGQSDAPDGHWAIDDLGRDVITILDWLQIDRVHFCGLSLGGLIGQWLGVNAADRLLSLTVANAAANFPPAQMWIERAEMVLSKGISTLIEPTLERWLTSYFRNHEPKRTSDIAAMIGATPKSGYAGGCAVLASADLKNDLHLIEAPTLVIAGIHDPSTPPSRSIEIAEHVRGSRLIELDAAHLSAVEVAFAFSQALVSHIRLV